MGDFADDMIAREIEWDLNMREALGPARRSGYRELTVEELGDIVWTPLEGPQLRVRDMTPRHRENALAMIERRNGEARVAASMIGRALKAWRGRP